MPIAYVDPLESSGFIRHVYDEVYPFGQDDLSTSYDERVSSANSPSAEEDDDLDVDGSEGDSNDEEDIGSAEPPIQSVIGPDGFRQFILLSLWITKSVEEESHPLEGIQMVEEKDGETLTDQQ
nr:hypothetical protein CFP56_55865 [Quercus suber]